MNVIIPAIFIAFLWGLSPIIHKHVLTTVNPKTIMVVSGLFYTTCLIIFGLYYYNEIAQDIKSLTPTTTLWIAFTAIVTGFLANLIYFFILKKHDSYVISALIYASPIFTLFLALFILKERVTTIGLIGVLLIVSGTVCLAFNEKTHHP